MPSLTRNSNTRGENTDASNWVCVCKDMIAAIGYHIQSA